MFTLQDVEQPAQHTSWRPELPDSALTAAAPPPSPHPAPGKR
jgi:hypothetical protein